MESGKLDLFLLERALATEVMLAAIRPGHPPGRVGFGSGQKKPGVFSSGPCPTRPGGRAVKLSPHPTRQPVGSGRVRVGSGRAYVKCRVPSGFSGFGSKFLARARPVSHTGSKILTRARPSNSSGRVRSGYFRTGWVGSVGSDSPCPGLTQGGRGAITLRCARATAARPSQHVWPSRPRR